jgi:hypothetical protein
MHDVDAFTLPKETSIEDDPASSHAYSLLYLWHPASERSRKLANSRSQDWRLSSIDSLYEGSSIRLMLTGIGSDGRCVLVNREDSLLIRTSLRALRQASPSYYQLLRAWASCQSL